MLEERTYTHENFSPAKETWGEGPWTDEPDKVQWVDEATDLDCLLVRNHFGAWCGYVGVPETHPCFGKGWIDVEAELSVHVHGGLTFADRCDPRAEESPELMSGAVCHVPYPGRPDPVWWLGFDCLHGGDYAPGMGVLNRELMEKMPPGVSASLPIDPLWHHAPYDHKKAITGGSVWVDSYKTIEYARGETIHLAAQLAAIA